MSRAIIDGVLYDTKDRDKMEMIAHDGYGLRSDPRYWEDALFLTEGPVFVLAGEGGPESKYAKEMKGPEKGYQGGETMRILSDAEARAWCEQHIDADKYLMIAARVGWTVRQPGEDVREIDGRGRLRVTGTSSLVISVTREAKALGLGRGDEVEYTIRKIPAEREAERWKAGESG